MKSNDLPLTTVDTLGHLLAQIAELTKQADAIKDGIKDSASAGGAKVVEGNLFKATYIESNRSVVDNKALLAELGATAEQIARHTKTTAVFSVKVTSR
jgi:methionine synthase I (cobalamin-dependent)